MLSGVIYTRGARGRSGCVGGCWVCEAYIGWTLGGLNRVHSERCGTGAVGGTTDGEQIRKDKGEVHQGSGYQGTTGGRKGVRSKQNREGGRGVKTRMLWWGGNGGVGGGWRGSSRMRLCIFFKGGGGTR